MKSYEPETFISGVYFGGEARHEVHRAPNARLANEQKQNRQILGAFFHFPSTLARNWTRRGTQKCRMTKIFEKVLAIASSDIIFNF